MVLSVVMDLLVVKLLGLSVVMDPLVAKATGLSVAMDPLVAMGTPVSLDMLPGGSSERQLSSASGQATMSVSEFKQFFGIRIITTLVLKLLLYLI